MLHPVTMVLRSESVVPAMPTVPSACRYPVALCKLMEGPCTRVKGCEMEAAVFCGHNRGLNGTRRARHMDLIVPVVREGIRTTVVWTVHMLVHI